MLPNPALTVRGLGPVTNKPNPLSLPQPVPSGPSRAEPGRAGPVRPQCGLGAARAGRSGRKRGVPGPDGPRRLREGDLRSGPNGVAQARLARVQSPIVPPARPDRARSSPPARLECARSCPKLSTCGPNMRPLGSKQSRSSLSRCQNRFSAALERVLVPETQRSTSGAPR